MYMGIDFGTKKLGIALSDTSNTLAFPHEVIPMNAEAVPYIQALATKQRVVGVVIGDTRTAAGEDNDVTPRLRQFLEVLSSVLSVPIHTTPEFGTSGAARSIPWEGSVRGTVASPRAVQKDTLHDARAAALILQRFLETQKK